MIKHIFACLMACGLLLFAACNQSKDTDLPIDAATAETPKAPASAEGDIIANQYIIELKSEVIASARERLDWSAVETREDKVEQMELLMPKVEAELTAWLDRFDISEEQILQIYTAAITGVALKLSDEQYELIRRDGAVASIEYDRMEKLPDFQVESIERNPDARAQFTPCGITNAGGFATAGTSRWIWIIDSGIDLDHPDLLVVTSSTYARSFVGGSANDCNGHGTHVAGTAAARNNTIGVVGVAAGAPVVPVRVFGCSGGSPTSTIVAGINHVAVYDLPGDVANLSLGGYYGFGCSTGSGYRSSLLSLGSSGTRIAIASGNSFNNAAYYQPACINGTNIHTVTNMRCNKTYYDDPTYGGNFGIPPVDWIATGTSVYSTYLNGGYATLTGTSMATPHVSGIMQIRNNSPLSGGTVSFSGSNYTIARR